MKCTITISIILILTHLLIAETKVPGGTIDGQIWQPENSPYLITGDITIENLNIQGGVEIIFTDNYKFEVNGIFQAEGFYGDSIYFKPDTLNQDGWEGIKFKNTSVFSSLAYCQIEGAVGAGIIVDQVNPAISNCRIIHNKGDGIRIKDASIEIKHCIISNNTNNGIFLDGSEISASNTIISRNAVNGIHSQNNRDAIILLNTVIAHNQGIGLNCERGALTVKNSIIFYNTEQIFFAEQFPNVTHSAVEGASEYPGNGNINSYPDFADTILYTLTSLSPCVDAGNPGPIYQDRYYPPSLGNSTNDMGTYGGPEAYGWFPPLYIKPQNISFGEVIRDSIKIIQASVLNYRSSGIAVSQIDFSDDSSNVFSSDAQNFFIPVLDSVQFDISFVPDQETLFQTEMIFKTLSHGDVQLPIEGEGIVAKMNLMLSALEFGPIDMGGFADIYIPIQNSGSDSLHLDIMLQDGSSFTLDKSSLVIAPDFSTDSVRLRFVPDMPQNYLDSLIIRSNDPLQPRVVLPVTGQGVGPVIEAYPFQLNFGMIPLFSDTTGLVTIKNSGNRQLRIDSLTIIDQHPDSIMFKTIPEHPVLPIIVETGDSVKIPVSFIPGDTVTSVARLLIKSNDPFQTASYISLSGTGIAGSLILSQDELNFGEVSLQTPKILNLVIGNNGSDVLLIDSLRIAVEGADSNVFIMSGNIAEQPFTLEPDSNRIVQVTFTPNHTGVTNALLHFQYKDPLTKEASVPLSGIGIAGSLSISPDELYFGEIDLGLNQILDLILSNNGTDEMTIDSLNIAGRMADSAAFELIQSGWELPATLQPDSNLTVKIKFEPLKTGIVTDSLQIKSGDPLRPKERILLRGTGIAPRIVLSADSLLFGLVPTGLDSLITLQIYNQGPANLLIPHDSLAITGTHASRFAIRNNSEDLIIEEGDSAALHINLHPVEPGLHQAELRIISNDPDYPVLPVILSAMAYNPNPVTIAFDPQESSNPFIFNQSATISFTITGSSFVDSAFVYVRSGGNRDYTSLPLTRQTGENWAAEMAASKITERGVEYYVHVLHNPTSSFYPTSGVNQPNTIQVSLPQISFPWSTKANVYQMISIPLETPGQNLKTLFEDQLGTYDNTRYRIYDLPDGAEYSEITGLDKVLSPGKALWLITKQEQNLSITNAHSVRTDQSFELSLQKGWNLIASPFAFPVDWTTISKQLALRHYDGTDWPFVTLLEPFKGYAVNVARDTVLLIPAQESVSIAKTMAGNQVNNLDWQIRISAESGNMKDMFNYVGTAQQAVSGIDSYDAPEPPPIGDFVSVYLTQKNSAEKFSTDFRETDMGEYEFEFEVAHNIDQPVDISFHPENLPDQYTWLLVSKEQGIYYPQASLRVSSNLSKYQLLAGTEEFISSAKAKFSPLPDSYHLKQNFPNPFNPSTTIKYSLPETGPVTIDLYNMLGQKINRLLDGVKKEPGVYQIIWDGKNQSGEPVASGIYFLQLKTKKSNHFIKMILTR